MAAAPAELARGDVEDAVGVADADRAGERGAARQQPEDPPQHHDEREAERHPRLAARVGLGGRTAMKMYASVIIAGTSQRASSVHATPRLPANIAAVYHAGAAMPVRYCVADVEPRRWRATRIAISSACS